MASDGNVDSDLNGGFMHYVTALLPLFSRLGVIALITLSHSATWISQHPTSMVAAKYIQTARNNVTNPLPHNSKTSGAHPSSTPLRANSKLEDTTRSLAASTGRLLHHSEQGGNFGQRYLPVHRHTIGGH